MTPTMKHILTLCIALALVSPTQAETIKSENHNDTTISRIAFGACNNPRRNTNGMYQAILGEKPNVFVFLGDNIYGDTEDMNVLQKKYNELGAIKGYQQLCKQSKVIATWDDHDYGINDGGNTYSMRKESEKIFLDFFGDWDPSLAFVMGGALLVYGVGSRLVQRRERPLVEREWHLPTRRDIDGRLLGGAALFGIGWGLGGFCPGPALTSLFAGFSGVIGILVFVGAMFAGMLVYDRVIR